MAVLTSYATGYTNQTGTTWANQANATGSTTSTYATWTNSTNGGTGSISYNGFGTWSDIPEGSVINSVSVTIKGYVNNSSRIASQSARLFIGATAKGTGVTTLSPNSTSSSNIYTTIVYTDVTLAVVPIKHLS